MDNLDYVLQLYRNVLSREGEDDGVNFWWGRLESGEITREGVLERFSDSPENKLKTENIFKYLRKYPDGSWDLYSSYLDGDSIEDYSNLDFDTIQAPSQLVIGVVNLMNSMLIVRPELRDSLFSNDEFSERVAVQTYFSSLDDNDYVSYAVLTVSTLKKQYPHDVAPSSTPYAVSYIEYDNNDIEINFAKLRSLWGCSRDYSHPTARCVQFSIGEANGAYSSGSVNLVPVTMGDFTWFEAK